MFFCFSATLPDMWERTITIGSAGKTFNATGWKVRKPHSHNILKYSPSVTDGHKMADIICIII